MVPPFVGVAVNVTESPEQIGPAGLAAILTSGTTVGFTVIVIPVLVTEVGLAQAALDVKIHDTTSPLLKVDDMNVAKLVPAFDPLICH